MGGGWLDHYLPSPNYQNTDAKKNHVQKNENLILTSLTCFGISVAAAIISLPPLLPILLVLRNQFQIYSRIEVAIPFQFESGQLLLLKRLERVGRG